MLFFKKREGVHSSSEIDSKRILNDDAPFAVREAYRTLYTNILYLPIEDKCKKFAVTSAFPGEGKTIMSVNLAYTIAMNSAESRILIIDADMRSPRVCDLISIKKRGLHGLSEYLAGIDDEPNIIPSIHGNLSVLAAGAESVNSPGLLCSSRMKKLLDYCSERFDYIIFDTPPVNIVSDAILLKDCVNGYFVVTRGDHSDINSVSIALDALNTAEANVLGFVLTAYDAKNGTRYGRYNKSGYGKYGRYYGRYGYGYGYGHRSSEPESEE